MPKCVLTNSIMVCDDIIEVEPNQDACDDGKAGTMQWEKRRIHKCKSCYYYEG